MNTVTTNALAQLNKEKQAHVIDEAQAKITYILKEQAQIAKYTDNIKIHQDQVTKMVADAITAESVFGRAPALNPTQNEITILQAIKQRNDEKQKSVEAAAQVHLTEIDGYNNSIKGCDERIAALRKELLELAADVVTETQVLG